MNAYFILFSMEDKQNTQQLRLPAAAPWTLLWPLALPPQLPALECAEEEPRRVSTLCEQSQEHTEANEGLLRRSHQIYL